MKFEFKICVEVTLTEVNYLTVTADSQEEARQLAAAYTEQCRIEGSVKGEDADGIVFNTAEYDVNSVVTQPETMCWMLDNELTDQ